MSKKVQRSLKYVLFVSNSKVYSFFILSYLRTLLFVCSQIIKVLKCRNVEPFEVYVVFCCDLQGRQDSRVLVLVMILF